MSIIPQPTTPLPGRIHRRKALPMTAAALALAGCGMMPQQASAPMTSEQQNAQERVKRYQADMELALDTVDRDRLRAASEKKPIVTVTTSSNAPAAERSTVLPLATNDSPAVAAPAIATPATMAEPSIAAPVPVAPSKVVSAIPAVTPSVHTMFPTVAVSAPTKAASRAEDISTVHGVNVSPIIEEKVPASAAVMTPLPTLNVPAAEAMGSMVAVVTPAQVAAVEPTPVAKPAEAGLDEALAIVRKNAADHPTLNSALALALLNDENSGEVSKKLSAADQKVLADLVAALQAMQGPGEGSGGGGKETVDAAGLAHRAAPLMEAAKGWQQDSDLSLPRMVLATRVDSFGVYTPIAGTFEQGKRHTVIIYCEVANFAAKKGDDGWFTTKLAQQETLITDDGLLVWRPNAEEIEDRSLNQRHDFYLVKKLTIPETLAAGKYTLRMSVTDRTSNKISVVSLPIEIVVKP